MQQVELIKITDLLCVSWLKFCYSSIDDMARWIRNGRQYSNACYFHFWVRSKISSRPLLVIGFEIEVGETRFGFTDHINLARHVNISPPPLPHPDPPPAPSCVRRRAGGDGSQAASMVILRRKPRRPAGGPIGDGNYCNEEVAWFLWYVFFLIHARALYDFVRVSCRSFVLV